jgi:hypothetical protein
MATRINLNGINELDLTLPGTTTATVSEGVASVVNTGGGGTSILLETNGAPNGSQVKLNLVAGTNVTLTDDGSGDVTIDATSSGGGGYPSVITSVLSSTTLTTSPYTYTFPLVPAGLYRISAYAVLTHAAGSGTVGLGTQINYADGFGSGIALGTGSTAGEISPFTGADFPVTALGTFYTAGTVAPVFQIYVSLTGSITSYAYTVPALVLERLA